MNFTTKLKLMYSGLCLFVLLLFVARPDLIPAAETGGMGIEEKIAETRDTVARYFTPLQAEVIKRNKDTIIISVEGNVHISLGTRLSVFRKGDPFYHPVTKELMGYSENPVGRIQVKKGTEKKGLYECSIIRGDIRAGDIARMTRSKIKLAFFQDRKADWALSERFFESLKGSGRFEIIEKYTPSYEPETLSRIASDAGADVVLMFSTPVKDKNRFFNVRLYWPEDAGMLDEINRQVGENDTVMLDEEDKFIYSSLVDSEPWGSFKISGGELFAIGDIDGNGEREIVVSDGVNLRIYSMKEELQELWLIKGNADEQHLSVDVLDVNRNGRSEIIVTSMIDVNEVTSTDDAMQSLSLKDTSGIKSFVIEYEPAEGYKRILSEQPYFFRVQGNSLLMQRFKSRKIFWGPVYSAKWSDGQFIPVNPLKLPEGVNIYGFVYVDWKNDGIRDVMSFDDKGYLSLYDDSGSLLWKSRDSFGRSEHIFEYATGSVFKPSDKWSVRRRLFTVVTDRGQEVMVVKKIPLVSKVPGLGAKGAAVYTLWWDGTSMDSRRILGDIAGAITDYRLDQGKMFFIARSNIISLVKNMASGEFVRGSYIYYYNFLNK